MGWFEGAADAVKGAVSSGVDAVQDFYTMDKTPEQAAIDAWNSSKGADKWSFVGTGEEMSEKDRKDLEKRMNQAGVAAPTRTEVATEKLNKYQDEANDKRLRRGITGALLGAGLGVAQHKGANKGSQVTAKRSANAGKLGTGYNALAQGRIFTK